MNSRFPTIFSLCLIILAQLSTAQVRINPDFGMSSAELYHEIKNLGVVGSVLYVAAHPDDENTRFLAYSANELGMRSAYLSLTRGDGGQNLVGKEVSTSLGVIRTQELLAARSIDNAEQFFSRAVDFSYSKHPDETFSIWEKDKILADAVWVIRKFRPDVIITRFSPDRAGRTHGHHTASAIIAKEAFKLAADKNAFPEQLEYVDTWQPKRILWNTSWWFYRGQEFDDSKLIKIDVSPYNANLGRSIGEIASESRSMHKSQGFGSSLKRDETIEYFEPLEGDNGNIEELFDFDHSYTRFGKEQLTLNQKLQKILSDFDIEDPALSIPSLLNLRNDIANLKDATWKETKLRQIDQIILASAGIWSDFYTQEEELCAGDSLKAELRLISRAASETKLKAIEVYVNDQPIMSLDDELNQDFLSGSKMNSNSIRSVLPTGSDASSPFWLREQGSFGMFSISDQELIGKPENDPPIVARVLLSLEGNDIGLEVPLMKRKTDPVDGESYTPVSIVPSATIEFKESVSVQKLGEKICLYVEVRAHTDGIQGVLSFKVPEGWLVEPEMRELDIANKGGSELLSFDVTAPGKTNRAFLGATLQVGKNSYDQSVELIEYDHIPRQMILRDAGVELVAVDLAPVEGKLGYIMGAGDAVPEALRRIGYEVDLLTEEDIVDQDLSEYKAIISGIRAFNVLDRISFYLPALDEYIENGGNFIIQYNTAHRLKAKRFGPYNISLSRDRVTVEEAEVSYLEKKHPVLRKPNKIGKEDFDGWVHERGLYFPSEWDEAMTPIFEMNDPGEDPKQGSLLVSQYGQGTFIYTGLSFFRELPAGVPGAYRLLVNLIEYKPGS